jgi:hypothetical protein
MFILSDSNLSRAHGLHAYEERPNRRCTCHVHEFEDIMVLDSKLEIDMKIR